MKRFHRDADGVIYGMADTGKWGYNRQYGC